MKNVPFASPLILAPIAGPGTVELTVAACEAGAFGILGSAYSTPDQILEDAASIRERTEKPFGINLFVDPVFPTPDPDVVARAHSALAPYYEDLGLPLPDAPGMPSFSYAEQIEAVLSVKPVVFSFTFGIPDVRTLSLMREAGIFTIGTATSVAEAVALERAGVDAVCAQGAEAGGHRGTFMGNAEDSLVGTIALVPQVVDAVALPVIASGGIADGRGIAAALALGAVAVQCGTVFLRAVEAGTSAAYRRALEEAHETDTMITPAFSGKAARGIRNRFSAEMSDPSLRAPYPYQNAITRDLRRKAAAAENEQFLSLWAGQAFRLGRSAPAAEIVRDMLAQAERAARQSMQTLEKSE